MVKTKKGKSCKRNRKSERTKNSNAFVITDFTASLNQKTEQAKRQTYISSRREGVASSHKRDKKESIKARENAKKQHYKVNFTTFLQKVNKVKKKLLDLPNPSSFSKKAKFKGRKKGAK